MKSHFDVERRAVNLQRVSNIKLNACLAKFSSHCEIAEIFVFTLTIPPNGGIPANDEIWRNFVED